MPVDNPADGGQNVHIVGGGVTVAGTIATADTVLDAAVSGGKVAVTDAQLPASLGAKAPGASTSVVVATAGAPVFGQKTAPTGTATALASTTTYVLGMTIYPDPSTDVYLALSAITVGTAATTGILRAGGAPMQIAGPVDPSTIYALAPSGSPVITWVAQ